MKECVNRVSPQLDNMGAGDVPGGDVISISRRYPQPASESLGACAHNLCAQRLEAGPFPSGSRRLTQTAGIL